MDSKVRLYALWFLLVLIFLKPAWHLVEFLHPDEEPQIPVQTQPHDSSPVPGAKVLEIPKPHTVVVADNQAKILKVNVMVSTNPSGANVWVDGVDTGAVTDSMLWGIAPGVHRFQYLKDGYVPLSAKLLVPSGSFFEAPVVELVPDDSGRDAASSIKTSSGEDTEKIEGTASPSRTTTAAGDFSQNMAELLFVTDPEQVSVVVSGKKIDASKPVKVKAGLIGIEASASGYASVLLNQYLKPGEKKTLPIRLVKRESPSSLVRLAQSFLSIENYDKAAQYFFQAVELNPGDYLLHLKLIDALFRADRNHEALAAVQRAEAILPDTQPLVYFHGLALFRCGHPKEALPYLTKAAKGGWSDEGKVESLAVCYESLEKWQDVLSTADRLCVIAPSGKACNLRGYALFRLGKYAQSTLAFERALQYSPQSYEILLNAAGAAMACGEKEKGERYLKSAMKVNPEAALARGILE